MSKSVLIVCRDGQHRKLFASGLSRFTVAAPGDALPGEMTFKRVILCTGVTDPTTSRKSDLHLANWLETTVMLRMSMLDPSDGE